MTIDLTSNSHFSNKSIELNQEFCSIIDVVKHIGYCRNTVWKALNGYKTIIPYTFIRLTDDLGVKNG